LKKNSTRQKLNKFSITSDLQLFLDNNSNKKVIVIQGLGFVGAVMSLVCANSITEEYAVIGVDLPTDNSIKKINALNSGEFPLIAEDPKIEEYFKNSISKGNLYATADTTAFSLADVIIVDVNLDVGKKSNEDYSLKDYDVDLTNFKKAISTIGKFCNANALVLVETTVPPGTCEKLIKPILENALGERGLPTCDLKIGHSYERVMPGPKYIDSIRNYPRVFSGIDEDSAIATEDFLRTIIDTSKCELTRLSSTTASEMAKVLENSYRASNIAFAVEWSRFAEEAGVDLWSIVNAIRVRKTHANLMFPNIGVGGYCLTKDPLLASWARKNFFGSNNDLEMSVNSVSTNDQMPVFAYKRLKSVFGRLDEKKVAFLGVSYRGDVGDTRFSPVESLYRLIKSDTTFIKVHDPYISRWDEVGVDVFFNLDDILTGDIDIIIISTAHSSYNSKELISKILSLPRCKIFDAVGLFNKKQILSLKDKHEISLIGSGNFT
jgi:UDP-N-acetyl-D-glucosamine dehydrogenase